MAVLPEQSGGQNSAYRSGCFLFLVQLRNLWVDCDAERDASCWQLYQQNITSIGFCGRPL
jgi:hypothetical protein